MTGGKATKFGSIGQKYLFPKDQAGDLREGVSGCYSDQIALHNKPLIL